MLKPSFETPFSGFKFDCCLMDWLQFAGSIRVFCRVRPFLLSERRPIWEPVSFGPDNVVVRSAGTRKEFEFDKVFHQSATQG